MSKIRIITDSAADIPPRLRRQLGIVVVPQEIHFGRERFRDGIDMDRSQFYARIENGEWPRLQPPRVEVFEKLYRRLGETSDAIISIHTSSLLSDSFLMASRARAALPASTCRVETIDSLSLSMALGFVAIEAARTARAGFGMEEVIDRIHWMIRHCHLLVFCDNLEYLKRQNLFSPAQMQMLARAKPLLVLNEGSLLLYERPRTRIRALDGLYNFIEDFPEMRAISVLYSTTSEDVGELLERIDLIYPRQKVIVSRYGPLLETLVGPGGMAVAVYEED
ncbi:MAG: DegV family protein [Chloroflexia bacterium]|nr:DegV family protein [Chloroflexia bacterium]